MTALSLDLRGLKCPLPVLRLRKALESAEPGAAFLVSCTDPMAAIDIPHLVRETGDALESSEQRGDVLLFRVRKSFRTGKSSGSESARSEGRR